MTDAGLHGYGRCARCGESFREDDAQAEVCGSAEDPSRDLLDPAVIHADCIQPGDVLA